MFNSELEYVSVACAYQFVSFLLANPKEFIIEHIEKVKTARLAKKDYPHLFDRTNVQATVRMVDPLGKGFITTEQYKDGKKCGRLSIILLY